MIVNTANSMDCGNNTRSNVLTEPKDSDFVIRNPPPIHSNESCQVDDSAILYFDASDIINGAEGNLASSPTMHADQGLNVVDNGAESNRIEGPECQVSASRAYIIYHLNFW